MRLCASLGTPDIDATAELADILEIRTDVFQDIPDTDMEMLITLADISHIGMVPEGFDGMLDVGMSDPPGTGAAVISSYHDHWGTPADIGETLGRLRGDIIKGAFHVRDFRDLMRIYDTAETLGRPHVLIGMGPMGTVTRIRQRLLGNEFTFCHAGTPTATGQLDVREMLSLGDDCMLTGLIGTDLTDASQRMHDNAFLEAGIRGKYLMLDTPDINMAGDAIRAYRIRGVNVTVPYKTSIMEQLDAVDPAAGRIGAVNTVVNDDGRLTGYNTDIVGIGHAFASADVDPDGQRAIVAGAGGAAKACIAFLTDSGCDVDVTARDMESAARVSEMFGCRPVPRDSVAMRMYDMVINCTPATDDAFLRTHHLDRSHAVFDMVYRAETALSAAAKERGCRMVDAKDMLASQAAASFGLWTGIEQAAGAFRCTL